MNLKKANVWVGLTVLVYASGFLWYSLPLGYSTKTGPGPGMFPVWVSGILIILSLLYIASGLKNKGVLFEDIIPKGNDLKNNLSVMGSIIVFMLTVNTIGFISACTALLFITLTRQYPWKVATGISIGVSIVLFATFQYLLEIQLPVNMFGW